MKMLQFITVLLSGLAAGLFYSYSCSVNPGLKSLADIDYLKSMQSINTAILNPAFFISFMGLLFVYPVTVFKMHHASPPMTFYLFIISLAIYYVGVFGVTIFCNVPLNDQLASYSLSTATPTEIAAMRRAFETPWNTFHAIRTFASILSFALLIIGLLVKNSPHENV